MQDNDVLKLGGVCIRLAALESQLGLLVGYTDPYRDRQWTLGSEPTPIGRAGRRQNKVELADQTVSREHAMIEYAEGGFFLRPESQVSPTFVNGEEIIEPRALADGDLVQFGQQVLRFRLGKGSARPRSLISQEATILFSDIWDYSAMAESRPLEETINQLNEFYRAIGQVIIAHQGKLMTFLGDALMATFGAQGHDEEAPMKAVMAALRMHERLGELNALWEKSGKPPIRIGVGINTGEVMVGDVGFTGHHEFAAMGDNTNLAARLEKLTREYNSAVLISGSTYNHVQLRILARHIGSTQVKGRRMPVEVYEVQGIRGE